MPKLFVTGATGYIGGDAFYAVANAYPHLDITALARSSDKGAKIASQYPRVRIVYGQLDNSDLLTQEASNADVVLHAANADHEGAVKALVAGLSQRSKPGYLIHVSGTGILAFADAREQTVGIRRDRVFNDWDGIKEVTSLPDYAIHRNVDKIVLGAGPASPGKIFTAIVCPPCIYGPGRGPDNQKSIQAYRMARATLQRGKAFHIGEGNNVWSQVHVQDLSGVFLALVTAALEGGGKATWNEEGYFFTENGDFVWGDVARAIAKIAHDKELIKTADVDSLTKEEAEQLLPHSSYYLGTNSRSKSYRANKLFGWSPRGKLLFDLLPEIVDLEAKDLGLIKSHAERAGGEV